ncbi:Nn.00g015920.m01.CDS01 [Neocucurbitaria sp. VM-36]
MVKNGGTCLYKEARLNVETAFPGSTIAFTLPSSSLGTFASRSNVKRTVITEQNTEQDEDGFTRRHLATDGSIFFRRHHEYPRSFLWRVLDNRKMLEIQAVDLDHDYNDKFEANLTLLLQFPSPIRPFCVAFAEPTDRDALTIFAITTANELYTITLHRDFFANPAASEQDIEAWCKRSEPALFSGRIPYRLVAQDVDELLVTLDDGAICRMVWDKTNHSWDGSRYQHSNWSVRGLLSWKAQPTVRYENADLAISAAATVAISPDRQHILSVCLDHTLRVWNLASGKPGAQMDILGHDDRALEKSHNSYFVGPSQSQLMAVLEVLGGVGGATYHVVTYSPKQHQFKFWGVRDADDPQFGLYDAAADAELIPPIDELMKTTVWTLEEFHIIPGPAGWRGSEIWIRARSGPSSRVYSLKFDLTDDPDTLSQTWKNDWVSVDSGPLTVESLRKNPANPSEQEPDTEHGDLDFTEQWLEFLFYPGRFTTATLETALFIFKRGLERTQFSRSSSKGSLKERICAAVTTLAMNSQHANQDAEQIGHAVASQWQAYYGLVKGLQKRRGESLSLTYDKATAMPWLILSDQISAIRGCSELEVAALNTATLSFPHSLSKPLRKALDKPDSRDVARLLNAASSFRQRLPRYVQRDIERHVEMDLLQSRSLTIIDRMEWIEGHSELLQHVSDEDLSQLVEELGTEVKDLSTETFLRAIQALGHEEEGRANSRKQIARYGLSALLRVSQETLEAEHNTLLDLLVLVLFMFVELEGETPEDFDASEVFVELIGQYKDCMTVSWLASTVWAHQSSTGPASDVVNRNVSESLKIGKKLPFTQTVLEGIFGSRAFDLPLPKGLKADLLSHWSRAWIASVFNEQNYDTVVEDIMGYLLFQKEYDLALDFSNFLNESNWSSYLKGRLHVALGENALASVCFEKAAYNLGKNTERMSMDSTVTTIALGLFNIEDADSASLVSEAERNSFSEGLARYYGHIISLFEKAKAYTYVADFARLGLRSLKGREDEELRTDLLQRLFTASIQTSRFQEAYSAMTRHSDAALKHSDLQTLITSMISQSQATQLLKFPLVGLTDDVDAILSSLCQKTLNLASGPPYHQILYSFRISRNNFRGAASILFERLQRLKTTSSKIHDPSDDSLTQCYLMIINTLSSVRQEDAYILAEQKIEGTAPPQWGIGQGKKLLKRQIITLETLRKEYQAELDRIAAIEGGQFPFVDPTDDMDIL